MPMRVPKEYEAVPKDAIRWVNVEYRHVWEQKGWKVNKKHGADYGKDDVVLMVKDGYEPKPKSVAK